MMLPFLPVYKKGHNLRLGVAIGSQLSHDALSNETRRKPQPSGTSTSTAEMYPSKERVPGAHCPSVAPGPESDGGLS